MKGAVADSAGQIHWTDCPDLADLGDEEVRIRVASSGINRADLVQAAGHYPPPPGASSILGLECAGVIEAIGSQVQASHFPAGQMLEVGDSVCALLAGGGLAETVVCPAAQVLPCPDGMTVHDAAAIPEVYATAWLNLVMEAAIQPGETILVHAGASGVGCASMQIARRMGCHCLVTVGSEEKANFCRQLGAKVVFRPSQGDADEAKVADMFTQVTELSGGGVDVVLDPVGGSYLSGNLQAMNLGGRLVLIGLMGGAQAALPLGLLMVKRLRLIGSTLRARPPHEKREILRQIHQFLWPSLQANGTNKSNTAFQPVIDSRYPASEVGQAYRRMAGNANIGKILIDLT